MRRATLLALALLLVTTSTVWAHWPVKGRVSQWYSRHHRGIDIAAPRGTPVRPIAGGTVVYAGWRNNCGGWQVYIRHDGWYSTYNHMSRQPDVVRGQRVNTATRLGVVGATGCTTGPHIHVEVWRGFPWASGSYRVNPYPYITAPHVQWVRVEPPRQARSFEVDLETNVGHHRGTHHRGPGPRLAGLSHRLAL